MNRSLSRCIKIFLILFISFNYLKAKAYDCDVAILGGTSSGVGATVTALREGKSVCLIARVNKIEALGGMITSGLNVSDSGIPTCKENTNDWTDCKLLGLEFGVIPYVRDTEHIDVGGARLVSGLFDEYRNMIQEHYGNFPSWEGLRHEPNIASHYITQILQDANTTNGKLKVLYGYVLGKEKPEIINNKISSIQIHSIDEQGHISDETTKIEAKYFIDATVTGDLADMSDVNMTINREVPKAHNEGFAGEVYWNSRKNKFLNITPKVDVAKEDNKTQAYSYFLTVKKENSKSDVIAVETTKAWEDVFGKNYSEKTDTIWSNEDAVCTKSDFIGAPDFNDSWAENGWSPGKTYFEINVHPKGSDLQGENYEYHLLDWVKRVEIENKHKKRALCFLKYWQDQDENISLATHFYDNGIPYRMYVRESRRMVGRYVFKEQDSTPYDFYSYRNDINSNLELRDAKYQRVINDHMEQSIGFSNYPIDSHAVSKHPEYDYYTDNNDTYHPGEGSFYLQFMSAPGVIPLGVIIPKEIDNLFVTTAISATHVGYGTLRMEPTRMQMGQVASVIASLAMEKQINKADDYFSTEFIWELQSKLIDKHNINIYFFLDIPKWDNDGNPTWYSKYAQMLAVRGLLNGEEYYNSYDFNATDEITREEFFVSLMKAIKWLKIPNKNEIPLKTFPDFDEVTSVTNQNLITELQQRDIIHGNPDGTLKPKKTINRAEVAKVLVLTFGFKEPENCTNTFSDVPNEDWYHDYVKIIHCNGIVQGTSNEDGTLTGKFEPSRHTNRAEAVKMIFKSIELYLKSKD